MYIIKRKNKGWFQKGHIPLAPFKKGQVSPYTLRLLGKEKLIYGD